MSEKSFVIDEKEIRQYWNFINPSNDNFIFQVFKKDRKATKQIDVDNVNRVIELCKKHNLEGLSCLSINPRKKGMTSFKSVSRITDIFIDVDVKKERRKNEVLSTLEDKKGAKKVMKKCVKKLEEKINFRVGMLVDSGNGYHIHIPVEMPIPSYLESKEDWDASVLKSKLASIEDILEEFENDVVEIDVLTKDIVRRVKIPGTWNVKKGMKEDDYRIAKIIKVNEGISIEDNDRVFNGLKPKKVVAQAPIEIPVDEKIELDDLLSSDKKIRKLFEGKWKDVERFVPEDEIQDYMAGNNCSRKEAKEKLKHYPSRSEAEHGLAVKLFQRGMPESKIRMVMPKSKIGKWNEKGVQYHNLTIMKAHEFAATHPLDKPGSVNSESPSVFPIGDKLELKIEYERDRRHSRDQWTYILEENGKPVMDKSSNRSPNMISRNVEAPLRRMLKEKMQITEGKVSEIIADLKKRFRAVDWSLLYTRQEREEEKEIMPDPFAIEAYEQAEELNTEESIRKGWEYLSLRDFSTPLIMELSVDYVITDKNQAIHEFLGIGKTAIGKDATSAILSARSAAGKSKAVKNATKHLPKLLFARASDLTEQAPFYLRDEFGSARVLQIFDSDLKEDSAVAKMVRKISIDDDGCSLMVTVTGKNELAHVERITLSKEINAILSTSTAVNYEDQLSTRVERMPIDSSPEKVYKVGEMKLEKGEQFPWEKEKQLDFRPDNDEKWLLRATWIALILTKRVDFYIPGLSGLKDYQPVEYARAMRDIDKVRGYINFWLALNAPKLTWIQHEGKIVGIAPPNIWMEAVAFCNQSLLSTYWEEDERTKKAIEAIQGIAGKELKIEFAAKTVFREAGLKRKEGYPILNNLEDRGVIIKTEEARGRKPAKYMFREAQKRNGYFDFAKKIDLDKLGKGEFPIEKSDPSQEFDRLWSHATNEYNKRVEEYSDYVIEELPIPIYDLEQRQFGVALNDGDREFVVPCGYGSESHPAHTTFPTESHIIEMFGLEGGEEGENGEEQKKHNNHKNHNKPKLDGERGVDGEKYKNHNNNRNIQNTTHHKIEDFGFSESHIKTLGFNDDQCQAIADVYEVLLQNPQHAWDIGALNVETKWKHLHILKETLQKLAMLPSNPTLIRCLDGNGKNYGINKKEFIEKVKKLHREKDKDGENQDNDCGQNNDDNDCDGNIEEMVEAEEVGEKAPIEPKTGEASKTKEAPHQREKDVDEENVGSEEKSKNNKMNRPQYCGVCRHFGNQNPFGDTEWCSKIHRFVSRRKDATHCKYFVRRKK